MPLNAGDIVRVSVRQRGPQGQDIVNVFHYRASATISDSDSTILDEIRTRMNTAFDYIESYIPSTQTPLDIKADVVQLVNGVETITRNLGTIPWPTTVYSPSGSGNVYAPGVAVGVLLRTLVGKVFGRKFIGVLMESALGDHGRLDTSAISAFMNMAAQFAAIITLTGGVLKPGVLSKRLAGFAEYAAYELATEAFYQRRRNVKVGS